MNEINSIISEILNRAQLAKKQEHILFPVKHELAKEVILKLIDLDFYVKKTNIPQHTDTLTWLKLSFDENNQWLSNNTNNPTKSNIYIPLSELVSLEIKDNSVFITKIQI